MNAVINDSKTIYSEVISLYNKINPVFSDLRGIGIQLSKLEKIPSMNSAMSYFLKHHATIKHSREDQTSHEKSEKNSKDRTVSNFHELYTTGESNSTARQAETICTKLENKINKEKGSTINNSTPNKVWIIKFITY